MYQPIRTLPNSTLHRANIELYRRHDNAGNDSGRCAACGRRAPCPVRQHAAKVILAAGEDPQWYDRHLPTGHASSWPVSTPTANQPASATPGVTGYALGSRDYRVAASDARYEA
jgi:hypothetical protein